MWINLGLFELIAALALLSLSAAQIELEGLGLSENAKVSRESIAVSQKVNSSIAVIVRQHEAVQTANDAHGRTFVEAMEAAVASANNVRINSRTKKTSAYVRYLEHLKIGIVEFERDTDVDDVQNVVDRLSKTPEVRGVSADIVVRKTGESGTLSYMEGISSLAKATNAPVKLTKVDTMISSAATPLSGGTNTTSVDDLTDGIPYAYRVPNDFYLGAQWGLADIRAFEAWAISVGGDNRQKVCVIDSGVDFLHPDIQLNAFVNEAELFGETGVDDDMNGYVDDIYGWNVIDPSAAPIDDDGHGTHVAGILGAATNNAIGVAGVNWGAVIVPCKFLDSNGEGTLTGALTCIDYSLAVECKISNNSWGSDFSDAALVDAIDIAAENGQLFVTSAGNKGDEGNPPQFPGFYNKTNQISVAATNIHTELALFSSYDPDNIHIAAPGDTIASTYVKDIYVYLSGTSMAAPFVSGAASLLRSYDSSLTFGDLRDLIFSTAVPFENSTDYVKFGKLDLNAAIRKLAGLEDTTTTTTTTATTTTTTTVSPPAADFVVASDSHKNCVELCEVYGYVCNEDATVTMNSDINQCFAAVTSKLQGDFVFGPASSVTSWVAPTGCYFGRDLVVHLNSNDYGSGHSGCLAPGSPSNVANAVFQVCACSLQG